MSSMCKVTRIALLCLVLAHGPAPLKADQKPSATIPVEIERIGDRVLVARCPIVSNVHAEPGLYQETSSLLYILRYPHRLAIFIQLHNRMGNPGASASSSAQCVTSLRVLGIV